MEVISKEKEFEILNLKGLHARAATKIVTKAREFSSEISFEKDGFEVNAKSVLEIITLSAGKGSKIHVRARGTDAEAALKAIEQLINEKFGEDG